MCSIYTKLSLSSSSTSRSALESERRQYRRRSDGSVDIQMADALALAVDPYGRDAPFGAPLQGRLMHGAGPSSRTGRHSRQHGPPVRAASMFAELDNDDDQLTREEKAARIRAEIARRRQKLVEGTATRYLQEELGGSPSRSGAYNQNHHHHHQQQLQHQQQHHQNQHHHQPPHHQHSHHSSNQIPSLRDAYYRPNMDHDGGVVRDDGHGSYVGPAYGTADELLYVDDPDDIALTRSYFSRSLDAGYDDYYDMRAAYDSTMDYGYSNTRSNTQHTQKKPRYPFPVKRILLTRDPKERSANGK